MTDLVKAGTEPGAELFKLLVDCVRDQAIVLLDIEGRVASWNMGAQLIKGYAPQEIVGRHLSTFHTADDVARDWPAYGLRQAAETGRFEDEGWRVRKDGSRFWANVIITALKRGDTVVAYSAVTRDITQRKQTEALDNVTRSINEFIAVIAHELRNPLAPIRSAVSLLKLDEAMSPDSSQVVEIIDRQSSQLSRIVSDIVDVSRITRGGFTVTRKATNVSDIINRAVEAARPAIDALGHSLVLKTTNAPLSIIGDELRLTQALTNLLNNAARYTEPGGEIQLTATTERSGAEPQLVLAVRDNGRGIDPSLREAIFSLFVHGEDKRNITGTGLGVGLALAKTIVEMHQGRLEVHSEGVGRGSEFVIRIPLIQEARLPGSGTGKPEQQRICILVVDDNRDAANLLASSLKPSGNHILTAYSGEEALVLFDKHCPHLVLLDIGMPRMNGYELARRIRRHPQGMNTYLVAVTGWGKDEDRYRSKEAGIDVHLVKPVEPEALMTILKAPMLADSKFECNCIK